ncbi:MAG TPA: hypothetical protein VGR15_07815 [Bacteroidota bacterium]|nr:hypothetical protein [Bacteroidota bacterium]
MELAQRTRILLVSVSAMTLMVVHPGYPQHLSSSRPIALAASTVFIDDLSSIDWNAAAMTNIKDWQVSFTNFYSPARSDHALTFQAAGIGKRFAGGHAAAFKFSPGATLEFVVPSVFTLEDSSQSLEFDKKISYREQAAIAFAFRMRGDVSLGLDVHLLDETVTDTKYTLDSNSTIRTSIVDYSGNTSTVGLGLLWLVDESWRLGAAAENLFSLTETPLDESVIQYDLLTPSLLRLGVGYAGLKNVLIAIDGDTKRQVRCGGELSLPALSSLQLRGGVYLDASSGMVADALGCGAGIDLEPLHFDLSYLAFLSQENRRGDASIGAFLQSGVSNIDFNKFTGDRISLTARASFGRARESLARIEHVDIASDIFPASQVRYALQPIGKARIRNVSSRRIDAVTSFYVSGLMEAPTQSQPQALQPGEVADVPLYAVFNDALKRVISMSVHEGEVYVAAASNDDYDDHVQTRILVHGKNDWNADVSSLKYFVTPDDPEVLRFTRDVLSEDKAAIDSVPGFMRDFQRAKIVFNAFIKRLSYVSDPKKSQEFVQYPLETLRLNGGDCDDLSVCYSSLLASMGISTSFVDVVPPDHPEQSHIYMMFNTGIDAAHAYAISDNPKRYVIRKNEHGTETAWIPVETTDMKKGFDEAWMAGAKEYLEDVELNFGIIKGWVKLVDFEALD